MKTLERSINGNRLEELFGFLRTQHHPATRAKLMVLNHRLQLLLRADIYPKRYLLRVYHLFSSFKEAFEQHLNKDGAVLLPYIEETWRLCCGGNCQGQLQEESFTGLLRLFRHEHKTLLEQMKQISETCKDSSTAPIGGSALNRLLKSFEALEADLQEHVNLENNLLYPSLLRIGYDIKSSSNKEKEAYQAGRLSPLPVIPQAALPVGSRDCE